MALSACFSLNDVAVKLLLAVHVPLSKGFLMNTAYIPTTGYGVDHTNTAEVALKSSALFSGDTMRITALSQGF